MSNQYTDKTELSPVKYKEFFYVVYRPKPNLFPDWYEYMVTKIESYYDIGYEFDSLYETYNGMQKLDRKGAIQAAEDLINEYYTDDEIKNMFDEGD